LPNLNNLRTITDMMETDDLTFQCLVARDDIRRMTRIAKKNAAVWRPSTMLEEARRG